jgi:hypothetical protein
VSDDRFEYHDPVWNEPVWIMMSGMIAFIIFAASSSVIAGQAPRKVPLQERAVAAMWNLRLAESVGDGATDAVVVVLDMSTRQGRRRKQVASVGIDGVGTTPTRARLKVFH